ncbi:hypothetical protein D3C84_1162130 [compost metagenome]
MAIATVTIIIRFFVPPYNSVNEHSLLIDLVKFIFLKLKYLTRKPRKLLVMCIIMDRVNLFVLK